MGETVIDRKMNTAIKAGPTSKIGKSIGNTPLSKSILQIHSSLRLKTP